MRAARRFAVLGIVSTTVYMAFPVAALLWGWTPFPPFEIPLAALAVAAFGLHLWRLRQLTRSLGQPAPAWFRAAATVVAVALPVVALLSVPGGPLWGIVGGVLVGDVIGGLRARTAALHVVGSTLAVLGLGVLFWWFRLGADGWSWEFVVIPALSAYFLATMWVVDSERLWWFRAVTDLEDSRRAADELATARERLRLADDLHDILGHALEAVAFKSELAARLLDVDDDRAQAEMEEMQRVARTAMAEVRALVRDTRNHPP